MGRIENLKLASIEDYLAGELTSPIKHEYVAGVVYAMAGARNAHSLIASNVLITLGAKLRGTPCRGFNPDTKIRIRTATQTRFYYPDVSIICPPNPQSDTFQDAPTVLFEVVSAGSRRVDEGEKRDSYLTISSLSTYVLLEQDFAGAVVYERGDQGFERQVYRDLEAIIPLPTIGTELRLDSAYDGVEFAS